VNTEIKWGGSEKTQEFLESLSLSNSKVNELRQEALPKVIQFLMFANVIVRNGGNVHGANRKATAKRRAANRAARKQRKAHGSR